MKATILLGVAGVLVMAGSMISAQAVAAEEYTVKAQNVSDPKVVFATVESVDIASARARIGGTIASLTVKEGDVVKAGQEIGLIGDEKLALQLKSLDAQISGLAAQAQKNSVDLKRAQELIQSGFVSKSKLDEISAASDVAANDLRSRQAQRSVIEQQMTEGKILAPSFGRILHVPVTVGSVVMPGETVATIAADSYVLRLRLPERHARFLKKGDKIHIEGGDMPGKTSTEGEIVLVYPEIENGRVVADAKVPDLSDFFVGERIRVWVSTAARPAFRIPAGFVVSKSGIDYVRLKVKDGQVYEVPVQLGHTQESSNVGEVEILSGVRDGDVLIAP